MRMRLQSILNHQPYVEIAWRQAANSSFDPLASPIVNVTVSNLRSATSYDFQFVACYTGLFEYEKTEVAYNDSFYQQPQQGRTKGLSTIGDGDDDDDGGGCGDETRTAFQLERRRHQKTFV